mmetsp:Transcript_17103/g.25283  ORF Transcript_17103/g.25283 Transcript_17103/m.25283 type:complete len:279 (+) Transcript_17103:156-992(+)
MSLRKPKTLEGGNKKQIVATLDLHGYRKDRAIRELTDFLDNMSKRPGKECWVKVVTGSGSHSQAGPVLRSKVSTLLLKREIDFSLNQGKGSFTVNAKSGFAFYKTLRQEDTKLQMLASRYESITLQPVSPSNSSQVYQLGSLMQASQDDAMKEESKRLEKQQARAEHEGIRTIKQAIIHSASEFEREEMIRKQEDDQFNKILEVSKREDREKVSPEDELLEKAVSMSVQCLREEQSEEERILKEVLSVSRQEVSIRSLDEKELYDQLQQAIKLSMQTN